MSEFLLDLLCEAGSVRVLDKTILNMVAEVFRDKMLSSLDGKARRHPLGFVHLSEQLDDRMTLRYHFWPVGWTLPSGQESGALHDHQFELNSIIVAGSLQQSTFNDLYDVNGGYAVFEVNYSSLGSALHSSGMRVNLEMETRNIFCAGTAYRLPPGVPHEIEPVARPSASVVLTVLSATPRLPRVFVPQGQVPPGEFERTPLNLDEVEATKKALQLVFG
jgi:hypothetical protein